MQNDIPDTQDVFVQTFIVATHLAGTWLVFNTNWLCSKASFERPAVRHARSSRENVESGFLIEVI